MYTSIAIFAFYNIIRKNVTLDEIENLAVESLIGSKRTIGKFIYFNWRWFQKLYEWMYIIVKNQTDKHIADGSWHNTWKFEVNPEGHTEGVNVHLIGCPIYDFAKTHDYLEIMPAFCHSDYKIFEVESYDKLAPVLFNPIILKGYRIGLTICYDCNHALFSRIYGVQGVDLILNSTGGNVVYDKWFKYNQSRAVENMCYTLVTMGGDGEKRNPNSYVYGFNPNGKTLKPDLLNGKSEQTNVPGGIYLYDLSLDDCGEEADSSLNQFPTENKYQDVFVPVGNVEALIGKAKKLEDNLYVLKHKEYHIVFVITNNEDIFSTEQFLPLMYSKKLSSYDNRRYIIVNQFENLTEEEYCNQLSIVLKVRAMENFCAVLLESDIRNMCYQTGKSKTAQVVKECNGQYGLDLSRMTGPEAIWKNKGSDYKASWRTNFVWLANKCKQIRDESEWRE